MKRSFFASICALVSLAAAGCGLKEDFPDRAIFVANGHGENISVIDPKTGRIVGDIPLDAGFHPHHLAISPDGRRLAVAAPSADLSHGHGGGHDGDGTSKVYLFDADNGDQNGVLDVDATVHNAAFLDDFKTFVIGKMERDAIAGYSISGLDEQWTTGVGDAPLEVTLVGGDRLLVANSGAGTLSIVDAATHASLDTADVGDTPVALWATRGGLFVSVEGDEQVAILNPGNLTEVIGRYDVGGIPGQVASAEAGGDVWIAVEDRGVVEVRATQTGEVVATVNVGGKPHGVLIDEQAGLVYVTDEGAARVVRIDAATHEVMDEIAVGEAPNGIVQNSL